MTSAFDPRFCHFQRRLCQNGRQLSVAKKKQLKTHSMRCPKPIKSGQLSEWACQITETLSNAIKRYRYSCRYSVSVRCCVVRACTLLGPINNHIWQLISSVRAAAILLHSVIYATFIWGPAEMLHISVSS